MRLLSRRDVLQRTGIPRSTWYELRARGEFPEPVRLGAQCVGWREADVERWIERYPPANALRRDL